MNPDSAIARAVCGALHDYYPEWDFTLVIKGDDRYLIRCQNGRRVEDVFVPHPDLDPDGTPYIEWIRLVRQHLDTMEWLRGRNVIEARVGDVRKWDVR